MADHDERRSGRGSAPSPTARLLECPAWHQQAPCSLDTPDDWQIDPHRPGQLARCRKVCGACPLAGPCLREALEEPFAGRALGPVRVGITGARSWTAVRRLADLFDPATDDDYDTLAA